MNAKTLKVLLALCGFVWLSAYRAASQIQTPSPTTTNVAASSGYVCVQRGPDSKVWQQAIVQTNAEGDVSTNYQSYTELATGLSYLDSNGQYVDSVEEVDAIPGGAQAVQGRHQVQWALNANTPGGAVTITTPDNKQLSASVFGLAYYDVDTGSNAPVAYIQDCTGTIAAPNQVIYANAFSNLTADLCYTCTKAGLSQDVVLRQAPLAPDAYGLSDATTVLQVYSEFFNTGEPEATAVTNGNVLDDRVLNFGAMSMGVGHALFVDGQQAPISASAVNKQWIHVNNRTFLVESVSWSAISNQVQALHPASNLNPRRASVRGLALLESGPKSSRLVKTPSDRTVMQLAKADTAGKRLVVDWDLLSGSTDITLQGDTTYLVSSLVNVTDILTVEGGTVVKYTNTGVGKIAVSKPIVFQTAPYRPAVFTSMFDSTVGSPVTTATNAPSVTSTYLSLNLYTSQTLRNCRFSYASTAVSVTSEASDLIKLWDCQFFGCWTGLADYADTGTVTLYAYNVLFSYVSFGLVDQGGAGTISAVAVNVTADKMQYFAYDFGTSAVVVTNCVLTSVTNLPGSSWLYNCAVYSSGSGVYQPTGAGGYYLNPTNGTYGGTNRGAGTASIDPNLLADLQTLTTYPPVILPTYITVNTNLSLMALRNTGAPDRGYHYSPIDYAVNSVVSNATVTVQPGTVLAGYGICAVQFWGASTFNCTGTATSPNYIVRYNTVQEQSNTNWQEPPQNWEACFFGATNGAAFQFTDWSVLAGDTIITYASATGPWLMTLQNCELYSGQIALRVQTLLSTNCLYQRVATTLTEAGTQSVPFTFNNNLFLDGSLTYKHAGTGIWTFRDNLFDQVLIWTNAGKYINICSNNAYMTNLAVTTLTNLLPNNHDVFLTSSPAYQVGSLGQFYYPTTQTSLIFNGSRSASAAGLSNYTVTANNVVDGANTVSIGFHYFPIAIGPEIILEPVTQTVSPGNSVMFTVGALAGLPLSHQWYENGVAVAGGTGASLVINPALASSAGTYTVLVWDAAGSTMSWNAMLKVAQNDFYVNYWNSNAISAISPMMRGTGPQGLEVPPTANVVQQATAKASLRGVQSGTDADTYNWMNLTSQGNGLLFLPPNGNYNTYGTNTNVTPTTTLQMMQLAYSNTASLVLTVNSRGDGFMTGPVWHQDPYPPAGHLEMLASNWVRYCNYIVQHYYWSNGIVVATNGAPPLSGNDQTIITTLTNYWVAGNNTSTNPTRNFPTLLSYSNFVVMPPVKYWEIGNEVETPMPTNDVGGTTFSADSYDTKYNSITTAMTNAVPSVLIQVGPGFAHPWDNSLIDPLLSDSNAVINFLVYHPYPASASNYFSTSNVTALATNLERINFWQNDVCGWQMDGHLVTNGVAADMPLFTTEWSGSDGAFNSPFASSMWTMLANAETLLCQVKGQRISLSTFYYSQWIDPNSPDWPLLYPQLQTNLGNLFLSSSYGEGIPTTYGPPGDGNAFDGSSESPFRIYSTMDTNTGRICVWMLNLTSSGNQTVDLHFPAGIASGTLYTLTNSTGAPSFMVTNNYGSANFFWLTNSVTWAGGNSVLLTNTPATIMIGQFALSNAPVPPKVPVINSVPSMGQPGQVITITGSNFSPNPMQNTVYFGPVRGVVSGAATNMLTVQVPFGSAYGPVTVTVSNLTAYSTTFFNPAYYGASVGNPISLQAVRTDMFTNTMSTNLFGAPNALTYFDADGDGKGDLAFAGVAAGNVGITGIFENQGGGAGSFVLSNTPYSLPQTDSPFGTAYGDFDGDGLLDWAVVMAVDGAVQVCRNASTPGHIFFAPGGRYVTGERPVDVKVMDFDGDGRPDLVVANAEDGTVSVYRNLSTGPGSIIFAQKMDFPACPTSIYNSSLAVGDFDGDGKPDIAVTSCTSTGTNLVVLRNLSTGPGSISFSAPVKVAENLDEPWGIAAGDFNGDGKLDLAVNESGAGRLFLYTNTSMVGSISFVLVSPQPATGSSPQGIAVGDLNGDGLLDIVVADSGDSEVSVFQNRGDGSFFLSTNCVTGTGVPIFGSVPNCVILADMDGDGRPDMAVGNFDATNVVIFQNNSQY